MDSVTTGAGNDLERSTELARRMVCEWGMSDAMGPLTFGKKEEQIFLGREIAQHRDYSEDTAIKIDQEVKRIVEEGYRSAYTILEVHRDSLIRLAEALLEFETLNGEEIDACIKGVNLEGKRPAAADIDSEGRPVKEKVPGTQPSLPHMI